MCKPCGYWGRYSLANLRRRSRTSCFGKRMGWGRGSGIGMKVFMVILLLHYNNEKRLPDIVSGAFLFLLYFTNIVKSSNHAFRHYGHVLCGTIFRIPSYTTNLAGGQSLESAERVCRRNKGYVVLFVEVVSNQTFWGRVLCKMREPSTALVMVPQSMPSFASFSRASISSGFWPSRSMG